MENKKKMKIVILVLCVSVVSVGAVMYSRLNRNPFRNVSVSDIQEIELGDPADLITTDKEDDITLIYRTLNGMKLKKMLPEKKDGFAAMVTMKLKTGKTIKVVIRSKDIVVNDKYYKPDKDYCDTFQSILQSLLTKNK